MIFVLIYGIFGVIDGILMVRYGRRDLSAAEESEGARRDRRDTVSGADETPVLTY